MDPLHGINAELELLWGPGWLWLGCHPARELLEGPQVALVVALSGSRRQRLLAEALHEEGRVMGGDLVGRWPKPVDQEFDPDCRIHQLLGKHFALIVLVTATG